MKETMVQSENGEEIGKGEGPTKVRETKFTTHNVFCITHICI